ncbi:glycosyltransferase [Chloroflexota bacterium]
MDISGKNLIKIDDKIILLSMMEDCTQHRLARYIEGNLQMNTPMDILFYQPLQDVFSGVIQYDFIRRMAETNIRGINDEIIALVKKEKPKYVLWISTMYEIMESTLDAIRQEGSIVVTWFGDDEYRFGHYCKWWLPHIDYCVTHDPESVPRYEALGSRAIFAFPCEGVPVQRDWSKIEEKYEVSFIGRKSKTNREQQISEIMNMNIPVSAFGRGWDGGFVTLEEMVDIFRTSKINLNFAGTGVRKGIKGRMTFICMAGGFLLTEYIPGLEDYFEIGKEIVCFNDTEEMIDKINYYLSHDEERRAIARAGWTRAVNEYTPTQMMSRIFTEIENDIATGEEKEQPVKMKMPIWVKNSPSQYYFQWGRAYMEAGYEDLWKDTLALALSSNPFNISAGYYSIIGLFPSSVRPLFFKLYLPFRAARKLFGKVIVRLLIWSNSIPGLNILKRNVSKKLHYS